MTCPACACPGAAVLWQVHCLRRECRLFCPRERIRYDAHCERTGYVAAFTLYNGDRVRDIQAALLPPVAW